MAGNRARTRAIRARMAATGEPYTLAARNHDAERSETHPPEPSATAVEPTEEH